MTKICSTCGATCDKGVCDTCFELDDEIEQEIRQNIDAAFVAFAQEEGAHIEITPVTDWDKTLAFMLMSWEPESKQ